METPNSPFENQPARKPLTDFASWFSLGVWRDQWLRRTLLLLALLTLVGTGIFGVWVYRLDQSIQTRFTEKRFAPPVEFFSAAERVRSGSSYPARYFEDFFSRKNFRRRNFGQPIQRGDFAVWSGPECVSLVGPPPSPAPSAATASALTDSSAVPAPEAVAEPPVVDRCVAFKNMIVTSDQPGAAPNNGADREPDVQIVALANDGRVLGTYIGDPPRFNESVRIEPELFAQYYGESPVLRKIITLGEAPTACLNALLAIEDSRFLEHSGVSFTGLLRALLVDLRSGRRVQGGSTITQQLVKNYFLTEERTLKRKITEIMMAFLVERRATKDEILETYINLIYMGQNGPFQVRGFAAASEHYFGKPLGDLGVDQCALLAAVLNSPGLYNPFKNAERSKARRDLVIDRMLNLQMISSDEATRYKGAALPVRPQRLLTEPAPYFVQAVRRELDSRKLDASEGLRVYTTLNLRAQEAAQSAVRNGLDQIEKTSATVKKIKASGKSLEALLLSSDPGTGEIQALVGGRGFLATQYNRALDSRRQVGSVMKPFTYLTAFEGLTPEGQPYSPLSPLKDEPTTHKFDGQTWRPQNYEGTYAGTVPLYWALKESLNAATVNLGMTVGLSNIIDTTRRLGIQSRIEKYPSLTLGAFELAPLEVLGAYGTLARMGNHADLTLIDHVDNLQSAELYRFSPKQKQVVGPEATAELVGVMKQTILSGTGRGVRGYGFLHPAAGKTGTTNDKKDAWFAGFTPYHAAVVWVGYDDNTSHNLTGGSGAVPIWASYMRSYASIFPPDDFTWPEGVEKRVLSPEDQAAAGAPEKKDPAVPIELIFKR